MAGFHLGWDAPRRFGDDLKAAGDRVEGTRIGGEPRKIETLDEAANQLDAIADVDKSTRPSSESIDRINLRTRPHEGLKAVAIHHVDWLLKQACDVRLDAT